MSENQNIEQPLPEIPKPAPARVPEIIAKQIAATEGPEQKAPAKVSIAALDLDELTPEKMVDNRPKEMLIDPHTRKKQMIASISLEVLFRAGLASVFAVNFLLATFEPGIYKVLLEPNAFVPAAVISDVVIKVASFVDLFIALLVLSGWYKRWVMGWAGLWLIILSIIRIGHFMS